MRPDMTMRPAQSGLMAESNSRTTLKLLLGNAFEAVLHGRNSASGAITKAEWPVAVGVSVAKGGCTVFATRCVVDEIEIPRGEFLRRVIHGVKA